jgi:hypothetical protein
MKRAFLIAAVCFLFLIGVASSAVLEVGVNEKLESNMSSLVYDNSSNLVKFSIELYNTGSVPFTARIKNEISDNNDLIFSGWSQEEGMMPGDKSMFDIYWYANSTGEYFSKLKVYFGNDLKEYKKFSLRISNYSEPEDAFDIKNFRTYDNYVVFDLESGVDAENIVVIPEEYTLGWIFEQKEIANMTQNSSKTVVLDYYPSLWIPSNISIGIASDNGKYYTEKTLEMKKIGGITGLFYYITDSLKIAFFK